MALLELFRYQESDDSNATPEPREQITTSLPFPCHSNHSPDSLESGWFQVSAKGCQLHYWLGGYDQHTMYSHCNELTFFVVGFDVKDGAITDKNCDFIAASFSSDTVANSSILYISAPVPVRWLQSSVLPASLAAHSLKLRRNWIENSNHAANPKPSVFLANQDLFDTHLAVGQHTLPSFESYPYALAQNPFTTMQNWTATVLWVTTKMLKPRAFCQFELVNCFDSFLDLPIQGGGCSVSPVLPI